MRVLMSHSARCRLGGGRALTLEALEDRRLLDAAPWQNPGYARDVNNDGVVVALDAGIVINRLLEVGIGPLAAPVPPTVPNFYYDTDGNNILSPSDALRIINRLIAPPEVAITSLVPFAIDVTPQITVSATSSVGIPDGAQVKVDVDLNRDGNFNGPGETNHTVASLFAGGSTFDITPGVPGGDAQGQPYNLKLRAHVSDSDGVEGFSPPFLLKIDTLMSNALKNYVDTPDPAYHWSLASTTTSTGAGPGWTSYTLDMKSQNWRTAADVDKVTWQSWVQIVVPAGTLDNTALLLIDGGSTNATPPGAADSALITAALATHSVVVDLKDVPNEPLTFTGDNPTRTRSEDAIIAYSFDQYMDHLGDPGNETWPVLVAMVKSAVRAMDSVQAFIPTVVTNGSIDDFVVTGYSKRGWTTWLTAAVDDRVIGMMPGVFDNLNQGEQMVHHYGVYGFFSPAVHDYNDLKIFDRIVSPAGEQLSQIVDPYRYLNNGRFQIPKLILNSAGDQFFVSDSAQFYIHDLPGDRNYLRYFPNTDHGLADAANDVLSSTIGFYNAILNNLPLPKYSWAVEADGTIHVQTVDTPTVVKLWQITNPNARDFRKDFISSSIVWTSSVLSDLGSGSYVGGTVMPEFGATAFFVELTFPGPPGGVPYVFTTEIHVNTNLPLFAWPFDNSGALPTSVAAPAWNATAASLALAAAAPKPLTLSETTSAAGSPPVAVAQAAAAQADTVFDGNDETPSDAWVDSIVADDASAKDASGEDASGEVGAIDFVFGSTLDEVLV